MGPFALGYDEVGGIWSFCLGADNDGIVIITHFAGIIIHIAYFYALYVGIEFEYGQCIGGNNYPQPIDTLGASYVA